MGRFITHTAIRRRRFPLIIGFILALFLASCVQTNLLYKAVAGSQIIVSSSIEPNTFNPQLMEQGVGILTYLYEGLIRENERGEIEAALAKSWEISEDQKQIIFTLRKNLKWSDGLPLTADDVVFTYQDIYTNPAIPSYAKDFLQIGKTRRFPTVRKLDNWRVEFTLPEPFAPFLRTTKLEILPAHILRASITTKDSAGRPLFLSTWGTDTPPNQIISNGAYKLETYIPSQRLTFRKNPYYWRKDAQGHTQPYIDRIVQSTVTNNDTSLIQFRSGGLDFIDVNPHYFSLLKREEKQGNFTIYNGGSQTGTTAMMFNLNTGSRNGQPLIDPLKSRWFNTVAFRQAIAHSIHRQRMVNNLFGGVGALQNSPIAVQSPYYLSPEAGLPVYEYNPQKAKALLQKAGFEYDNQDQLRDSDGNRVKFTLTANVGNKVLENMAPLIQDDLKQIGIQVDLNLINVGLVVDKLANRLDWECQILDGFPMTIEPNEAVNIWSTVGNSHFFNRQPQSGQIPITGQQVADWEEKIGELYIQGAASSEAKRQQIYAETQRLSQEYLPFIYLVNSLSMVSVRNRIQGVKHSALQGTFWNVYELKTDPVKN
ncbi:ABC transporter substrate-binding protein [Nodularia sphaerocarpa]|uniref:ABC transporter substrate-binding protein n=1 Tax=Nodularia sphaerocarpa TaxID=137816 RepID=UPI001EFB6831|nr:ABC transporter substrate-binding protein [Nodularia sphaerocarpa]MDB9373586.1 ABC transporter substrate-binding protein [Nodularia sphaerocarpa CS-585]MDB9378029.1 ABC transporter substrate-binding protein [Nodularia sphaerocarpa CS-585A2]ULP74374.1 putative ABC transporter-binding protein [Nodularia sphaerocarpa UHCC 0038]